MPTAMNSDGRVQSESGVMIRMEVSVGVIEINFTK